MNMALSPGRIRCAPPREVIDQLQEALKTSSEDEVTHQLLELVEHGSLPPTLFSLWLCLATSPSVIKQALEQKVSVLIRFSAIKRLSNCLRSPRWKDTWDGLGGVDGFLALFSGLSELEVKDACHAVGYSARGADREEKQKCFTDFFKALEPRLFAEPHNTLDRRPLERLYHVLIPACTEEMVARFIDGGLESVKSVQRGHLLEHQPAVLQAQVSKYVLEGHEPGKEWLAPMFSQYPSTTSSVKGFSASMLFSLDVLRSLAEHESPNLNGKMLMKELAVPLLRRALKKGAEWPKIHVIVRLTMQCLERNSGIKELGYERRGFVHMVGKCWSRQPELFVKEFETLLVGSGKGSRASIIGDPIRTLHQIPRNRRYAMLEFCFKAIGHDLNDPKHLKEDFEMIPFDLLPKLPPEEALAFFIRLRSAKGDENLIQRGSMDSVIGYNAISPNRYDKSGDPDLWETVLLQRSGRQKEAEELALVQIEARKKIAMNSSTSEQRASFAKAVIVYAVASGSSDMYKKELMWARRYIRDPGAVTSLWQTHVDEAKELMTGIPELQLLRKGISTQDLGDRIKSGNHILEVLFDTVFSALREPTFKAHHWHGTLCLPFFVVQQRMKRSFELKKYLGFSDQKIYDVLWKDTVAMLISLEKESLVPGREGLNTDGLRGILQYRKMTPAFLDNEEPSTYRFFDDLAKARDELWRQFRPTIYPAVTNLPKPFPRGLPIHHLMEPYVLQLPDIEVHAPYIARRMNKAVFLDQQLASVPVSEDTEVRTAIGPFVDDYTYALRLYIPSNLNEVEKTKRIEKAWAHATGPLSYSRLSPEEALRFWGKYGPTDSDLPKGWPLRWREVSLIEDWPFVPKVDNTHEIEEWDPVPPAKTLVKTREMQPLKYIDLSRDRSWRTRWPNVSSVPQNLSVNLPGDAAEDRDLWSAERLERACKRPALREGLVLSALLHLDISNAANTRILSTPFPTSEEANLRYPALYLDNEFLANKQVNMYSSRGTLRRHIRDVPPNLLAHVVKNTISRLNATDEKADDFITLEQTAFDLVKLLGESDRPSLASDLAIQCILDRPEASSWHRQLLSQRYFKRLPATDAKICITAFADAIITRVEEQAASKAEAYVVKKARVSEGNVPEVSAGNDKDKSPFVKITTVKYLAQLLRGASFISEEFALTVLSKLLLEASHIDIRRSIVSSLLKMLTSVSLPLETANRILAALEVVIPMASNLRERDPITEAEWIQSEETLTPPEVPNPDYSEAERPLLNSLLEFLKPKSESKTTDYQGAYLTRIILPILDRFKQQTARWTSIFLRQHGFTAIEINELDIPPLPLHKQIPETLILKSSAYITLSVLEEYVTYLKFNIDPPASIIALNQKLDDDATMRSSTQVKFWLHRFAVGSKVIHQPGRSTALIFMTLLNKPSQLENHITPHTIQEQYLKLLTLLIWHDKEDLSNVRAFLSRLGTYDHSEKWVDFHKPIAEAAITYIEGLRTRDWERGDDGKRQPAFLPDTWECRMCILRYYTQHSEALHADAALSGPSGEKKGNARDAHCSAFATRVTRITDAMAGTIYHRKLASLQRAVGFLCGDDKLRVACYLGNVKNTRLSWLTKPDLLRLEVAAHLVLDGGRAEDDEVEDRVKLMVEEWRVCSSEDVRRFAVEIRVKWGIK